MLSEIDDVDALRPYLLARLRAAPMALLQELAGYIIVLRAYAQAHHSQLPLVRDCVKLLATDVEATWA